MADPKKIIQLAPEKWSEEFRPLLVRLWVRRPLYLVGIVAAIERGDAVLFVARVDGAAVGALVLAFQPWPVATVRVLGMVTLPKTGFAWGPALWPSVQALAKKAGAESVTVEARTEANRRRLRRLGFVDVSTVMVCPC